MILYVFPISPNCRVAEAVAQHLNMDIEVISMDTASGDVGKSEFLALNPNGKVPTLVEGDHTLWESRAIMQHLADMSGESVFFPAPGPARSDIVRWIFWEVLHYNKAIGTVCWETVAKAVMNMGDADEDAVSAGLEEFHRFAPVLETQLEGKAYVMGDDLTLADFAVGSHAALARSSRSRMPLDQYPNIVAWYGRLDGIPAWDATKPPFDL